jgi:ribonuclease PH
VQGQVSAVSCGIFQNTPVLDLDYAEDSSAEVDANFVIADDGRLIEIQATGEQRPFSDAEFADLMRLAKKGGAELFAQQKSAIGAKAGG